MNTWSGWLFSGSLGRNWPRSTISTSSPVSFSAHARVPPPIPEPMITTSAINVSASGVTSAPGRSGGRMSTTSLLADAADPRRGLFAGPDDGALVLDVLLDRGTAELPADAGSAIATEGDLGETVHVTVDPDRASLGRPRVAESRVDVAAPDTGAKPVTSGVGDLHRLVEIGESDDRQHGSEDFLPSDSGGLRYSGEHRWRVVASAIGGQPV